MNSSMYSGVQGKPNAHHFATKNCASQCSTETGKATSPTAVRATVTRRSLPARMNMTKRMSSGSPPTSSIPKDSPPKCVECQELSYQACCGFCSAACNKLVEALQMHKIEQQKSFRGLKSALELRMNYLEHRVNTSDTICASESLANMVKGLHINLDESHAKMQESVKKARNELEQTGHTLAAQLRRINSNSATMSVCEVLTSSIMDSLGGASKYSQGPCQRLKTIHDGKCKTGSSCQHSSLQVLSKDDDQENLPNKSDSEKPSPRAGHDSFAWQDSGSLDSENAHSEAQQTSKSWVGNAFSYVEERSRALHQPARGQDNRTTCTSPGQHGVSTKEKGCDPQVLCSLPCGGPEVPKDLP